MRFLVPALAAAVVAATLALAGGGPPPPQPPAPAPGTIVAHGTGSARVAAPARRTNATIGRAVRRARRAALPRAVADASRTARQLGAAAGMRAGKVVAVAHDVPPPGFWDEGAGRFGPGRWCGPVTSTRTVGVRRIRRTRRSCPVPRDSVVRVTVTVAAAAR